MGVTALLATRSADVDGLRLRYHTSGSGPDVLLLHGFPETLQAWYGVVPHLARAHRVHAFDWPGFGGSARPWPWDYSAGGFAAFLERVVEALGLERPHLVGTDIGMLPALLFALDRPERAGKVVVMDGQPFRRTRRISWELHALRLRGPGELLARVASKRATWWGLRRGFAGKITTPRDVRKDFYAQSGDRTTQKAGLRFFRSFGRDVFISPEMGEELHRRVPGSRLEVIEGAGHFVHMERPDTVSRLVADFLAD